MNLDNQKPLSSEEIERINNISENFKIVSISGYPGKDTHLKVSWRLPIEITRNEDEFWLTIKEVNKENYWVVYPKVDKGLYIKPKQFKEFEDALNYGLSEYSSWLDESKDKAEDILNDLKGTQ